MRIGRILCKINNIHKGAFKLVASNLLCKFTLKYFERFSLLPEYIPIKFILLTSSVKQLTLEREREREREIVNRRKKKPIGE